MSGRFVYRIHHQTTYQYSLPVRLSHQVLHLTPRELPWQQCLSHTVNVLPAPQLVRSYEDNFGNVIKAFSLDTDHTSLDVQADSWVALTPRPQPQPGMQWEEAATVMAYHGGRIMAPGMLEASISCSNPRMCASSASSSAMRPSASVPACRWWRACAP
jgi:transglutaminase-like putative cysteine protease